MIVWSLDRFESWFNWESCAGLPVNNLIHRENELLKVTISTLEKVGNDEINIWEELLNKRLV